MKKYFILVLFFILIVQHGFSQIFVGGGLTLSYNSNERMNSEFSAFNLGVNPMLGYRFGNIDIGILFGYRWTNSTNSNFGTTPWEIETRTTQIDVGIFGDLTVFRFDRFSILGRGIVQFSIFNSETNITGPVITTPDRTERFITVAIAPMFEYFVLDRLTVFTSIGGISYSHYFTDVDMSTQFNISFLTGLTIGFRFFM